MYNAFKATQHEFNRRDRFMRLIVEQDVQRVKACLESGYIDVNQSHGVMKPLHLAVLTENLDMVTVLVDQGALLDTFDAYNMAPLHYAVRRSIDVVAFLLLNDADPNVRDAQGKTPLHIAVRSQKASVVELILARGNVAVNAQDSFGETPLHKAMRNPDYFIIRNLIEYNADPNIRSHSATIPLEDLMLRLQTDLDLLVKPGQEPVLERCLRLLLRVSSRYNSKQQFSNIPIDLEVILPYDIVAELQRDFPCCLKTESLSSLRKQFPQGVSLEECFKRLPIPDTLRSFCLLDDI